MARASAASTTTSRPSASSPAGAPLSAFAGLNLTWETLEGVVKHNGPAAACWTGRPGREIVAFDAEWPSGAGRLASAEAQVAALADDIAYNNHDVDDGLQAGLFRLEELADVALVGPILADVRADCPGLESA